MQGKITTKTTFNQLIEAIFSEKFGLSLLDFKQRRDLFAAK